jgi:hypothetical protein
VTAKLAEAPNTYVLVGDCNGKSDLFSPEHAYRTAKLLTDSNFTTINCTTMDGYEFCPGCRQPFRKPNGLGVHLHRNASCVQEANSQSDEDEGSFFSGLELSYLPGPAELSSHEYCDSPPIDDGQQDDGQLDLMFSDMNESFISHHADDDANKDDNNDEVHSHAGDLHDTGDSNADTSMRDADISMYDPGEEHEFGLPDEDHQNRHDANSGQSGAQETLNDDEVILCEILEGFAFNAETLSDEEQDDDVSETSSLLCNDKDDGSQYGIQYVSQDGNQDRFQYSDADVHPKSALFLKTTSRKLTFRLVSTSKHPPLHLLPPFQQVHMMEYTNNFLTIRNRGG